MQGLARRLQVAWRTVWRAIRPLLEARAEAVNGLIELHRRIARGFRNRDNYGLRMLLIAGGLDT